MTIKPIQLLASITQNVHRLATRPAVNVDGLEDQLSDIQNELGNITELLDEYLFQDEEAYWQEEQLAYTRLLFDRLLNNFPQKEASELIIEANQDAAKIVNTLKSLSSFVDNAENHTEYEEDMPSLSDYSRYPAIPVTITRS